MTIKETIKSLIALKQELNGIREAATLTGCRDLTIVTRDMEEDVRDAQGIIHIVPAWKWFLGR